MSAILLAEGHRGSVDAEIEKLIRSSIAGKGGLSGMAYRAGFAMLEKAKPGILTRGVQKLLPLFMQPLDALHAQYRREGGKEDFAAYMKKHAKTAAAAILGVADARMTTASEGARKYYTKFRGGAEDEVRAAMPALGAIIQKYVK